MNSRALLGRDEAHWSFFFASDASVMEGNDIEDLGGGVFRTVGAVSRYSALDQYAMGLRAESSVGQVRDELNTAGKLATSRSGRDQASGAMSAALERNEDLLRMDPNSGLGELAESTGGFLIANTNDLRAGFERI